MKITSKFFLFLFASCFSALAMGSSISSIQQTLSNLGFYHGPIDGQMGSATSAALRRFQLANHLRPTGTLTPQTSEALGLSPNKFSRTSVKQPPTVILPNPKMLADLFVGGPLLAASPAIQIATVEKAQRNLKILGYYGGPINGVPDATLKAALQAYQKDSHFKRTGRLDKITLMGLDILPGSYQPGQ